MRLKPIEQSLLASLSDSALLAAGDRLGVAVSGGADSVALLRLLYSLRARLGITLTVLHFDHRLRGDESQEDARFVADLARSLDLEFILDGEDVRAAAARHKWNLEDAGRRLRYAFFERMAGEKRVTRIAVAHTADDQGETVLARLIRGTGPTGLAAIYPVVGHVVRPLLTHRREELRAYLRALGQPWREDATNRDIERLRARIRERLMPLLAKEFSPRIVEHLAGLAQLAREEEIFWNALAGDCLARLATVSREKSSIAVADLLSPFSFSAKDDPATPPPASPLLSTSPMSANSVRALTERLIRKMYAAARGNLHKLTAAQVAQVIHLASRSTSGRRLELPGGISVYRDFGQIAFVPGVRANSHSTAAVASRATSGYAYILGLPDRGSAAVSVPELHTRFRLKVIDWPDAERETRVEYGALDAERLSSPLILRNWRPGDSYRPIERRRARKLKEMLREARVSRGERVSWPVLESCGRIVWARGLPPAGDFCACDGTRVGVLIEMSADPPASE